MIKFNLDWESVRAACIENEWYTCGNIAEYENMLDYVRENCNDMCDLNVELHLEFIAMDIFAHSDKKRLLDISDCTVKEYYEHIAGVLLNRCYMTIVPEW